MCRIKVGSSFLIILPLAHLLPWEQAWLHPHLFLWPSMGSRCYIWTYPGPAWPRVPDELKSPRSPTQLCFPVRDCVHLEDGVEEQFSNLPRNFLWVSRWLCLYSPGPPLNWKSLESRSCLIVLVHSQWILTQVPVLARDPCWVALSHCYWVCAGASVCMTCCPDDTSLPLAIRLFNHSLTFLFLFASSHPLSLLPSPSWVGGGAMGGTLVWWPPILNGNHHPTRCGFCILDFILINN